MKIILTADVKDLGHKGDVLDVADGFARNYLIPKSFAIKATAGTHEYLAGHGINPEVILKEHEGRPNITDAIKNGEIQLVVNTPSGKLSVEDDSYIRKAAIKYKVPYITTTAAAISAAKGIAAYRKGHGKVKSLQEYHADI